MPNQPHTKSPPRLPCSTTIADNRETEGLDNARGRASCSSPARGSRRKALPNMNDLTLVRFLSHTSTKDQCWLWTGALNASGYGVFGVDGRTVYAHRYAYAALVGPIPDDLELDHLCRVTRCVNPFHLEGVTRTENLLRRVLKSKTHCIRGHEFTPENTYSHQTRPTRRICLTCQRLRRKERWIREKANANR